MSWKKLSAIALTAIMSVTALSACGSKSASTQNADGSTTIDTLKVAFVPSRNPDEIVTATEPLKDLLKKQLKTEGYDVAKVDITVGTSYEAVGEGLEAGSVDVGFIPAGTYLLYKDGAKVLLTATRDGLSNDSENPKDWNEHKPTKAVDKQVSYYRALFIAGPSEKGKALGEKVNAGDKLTWDDLKDAKIGVMNPSSGAGYIHPTLWFHDNFDKTILDLGPNAVTSDSYGSAFARLASGQLDALWAYADARRDMEQNWTTKFGRKASIWDETNVIGVTGKIYNDTISVSKNSKTMTPEFDKAFAKAMIDIAKTPEGQKVIAIYSHKGYVEAKDSDYDGEAKAQELVKSIKK